MPTYSIHDYYAVMPEGEKHWGVPVEIGLDNLPSPVGIGITALIYLQSFILSRLHFSVEGSKFDKNK